MFVVGFGVIDKMLIHHIILFTGFDVNGFG